jgi:hypothetical protein
MVESGSASRSVRWNALPNPQAHECHAERQPAEQTHRDDRFKADRRIGLVIGILSLIRSGIHGVAPSGELIVWKSFFFQAKIMPSGLILETVTGSRNDD